MQGSQLGKPTHTLSVMIGALGGRISPRRRGTCSYTAGEEKGSGWGLKIFNSLVFLDLGI